MSESVFTREQILENIISVLETQESISAFVGKRLCDHCELPEDDWEERRKDIIKRLKNLVTKYDFAKSLPKNELGIGALSILGYLLKIQHTYSQVIIMIDMIRGESFGEVFFEAMDAISTKTHQEFTLLKNLAISRLESSEITSEAFNSILRLEREIDEDNIIICRQISTLSVEGETNFTCYIMRKIVSELEHISDFIKEAAEIIVDI